ncbi:hypothetical protein SAMN00777080_0973 [Aquiflexum balticum DSM 16537]|uniref:DUF2290 domain-containing protein n=1 Tax=Aquiflexum balticum DSM 16537 TaxID=758820 RepID=A0A1W2H0J5_9BACT|nr:hypothetical protein [Aquiflexum balticum]SMD42423.1 hypothetical protein SAMN00777080_0973 [Aquiflexum balticum DSM 16537]
MRIAEIKHDINVLADLLGNWGKYVKNPDLLHKISVVKTGDYISYSIDEPMFLVFQNFDIERHAIPHGIEKLDNSEIDRQVKLNVLLEELISVDNEFDDRVSRLGLNLIVEVKYFEDSNFKEVYSGFHFDRGDCGMSEFCHPIYHCTYGGKSLKPFGSELGKLFSNAGPRIIHPPMELVLGVDFVIRNYYKKENHIKITEDPRYTALLKRAHINYWLPYSIAFQKINPSFEVISNLDFKSLKGF